MYFGGFRFQSIGSLVLSMIRHYNPVGGMHYAGPVGDVGPGVHHVYPGGFSYDDVRVPDPYDVRSVPDAGRVVPVADDGLRGFFGVDDLVGDSFSDESFYEDSSGIVSVLDEVNDAIAAASQTNLLDGDPVYERLFSLFDEMGLFNR